MTLPVDEESVKDMVPANGQAPVSEKELVQALTEHAHKIAQSVLAGDGTGENLIRDAEVRYIANQYWIWEQMQLTKEMSLFNNFMSY